MQRFGEEIEFRDTEFGSVIDLRDVATSVEQTLRTRPDDPRLSSRPSAIAAALNEVCRALKAVGTSRLWLAIRLTIGRRTPQTAGRIHPVPIATIRVHQDVFGTLRGLWLVEPHFACAEFGAKWEEILVIEKGKATWLEDEPPHVREWSGS